MIEILRSWLLGITAAVLCIALAEQLVVQAGMKRTLRLAGGIILIIVLLNPLNKLCKFSWDTSIASPGESQKKLEEELRQSSQEAMQQGIAEALNAYIWDKGQSMGANCTVSVEISADEAGTPIIKTVTLTGEYCESLSKWLEEEMEVSPEQQIWQEE